MDYLKKLGVECIYFNPIFDAPTNHRYDANDYLDIDPMLGNNADFGDLVAAAHARGIKIVLDAVFNHCSCDSIYFDLPGKHGGAAADKESPYFRWFNFSKWPDEYQNWEGVQNMPEFVECPEVEDFFLGAGGVTAYWLIKGIDGWRTDVTDCNSDTFWRRFRERVNTLRPDAYLVSEEWEDASHYLVGDTFSATMNYRFTWAVQGFFIDQQLTAAQFEDRLATLRNDTPPPALLAQMNLLGSHDVRRILTECDEDTELLFQVVAFQMAYPGAPLVYYGDEAGLTGAYAEAGRGAFPWGNEHAGIMAFFRQVIAARNDYPALRDGDYQTLLVNDEWRLHAFARRQGEQVVVAVFNAGELTMAFDVPVEGAVDGPWRDVLGRGDEATSKDGVLKVRLPAGGMAWYVPQSTEPAKEE
jgi:glycosidase